MDAIFKVPSSEFNEEVFNKIIVFLQGRNAEITINDKVEPGFRKETNEEYWNRLSKSITDIEEGKGTIFTMEELENFINE